jgi:hypothetical protein
VVLLTVVYSCSVLFRYCNIALGPPSWVRKKHTVNRCTCPATQCYLQRCNTLTYFITTVVTVVLLEITDAKKFVELCRGSNKYFTVLIKSRPIPAAARSKAWVCGRSLAGIAGSSPAGDWMCVSCEYCVLSGRGLCVGLITRPEESYRLWCV